MKNPSRKFVVLLLLLVMVLTGCTQPAMEEELKNLTPEATETPTIPATPTTPTTPIEPTEKEDPVVAIINLPEAQIPQTRTLLPGKLETASSYRVTLNYDKENEITPGINVKPGKIEITGVTPGKYSIMVEGLDAAGKVILSGTNSETELFEIVEDQIREITIKLHAVRNAEETGKIAVTFNWATILNLIPVDPTEQDLAKLGPISNAIHDGYMKFQIFVATETEDYTLKGSTEWNMQDQTWEEISKVNSFTCEFPEIPSGDVYVNFSILNKDNVVLASHIFNEVAKVYVGQTSYFEGDIANEFKLNKIDDVYSFNIRNLEVSYPETTEREDKDFVITWSEPCEFESVELQLWKEGDAAGTPITSIDTARKTATIEIQPNTNYFITSKAKSTDGTTSNIRTWKRDDGSFFRAKEKISSITYNGEVPAETMRTGEAFELTAAIAPETATYQNLTWEATVPGTLYITNTASIGNSVNIRANKPGVTGIMVKNDDPFNGWAKETGHEISIRLSTPTGLMTDQYHDAQGQLRGVSVNWNVVEFAENYEVYRRVNGAGEFHRIATTPSDETSYADLDVEYGKSYEYQIRAIAPALEAEIKAQHPSYSTTASDNCAASEPVTLPIPHISLEVVEVENKIFNLTDNTTDGSAVYSHAGDQLVQLKPNESRTIKLSEPIPGMTEYKWYVNGKHPKANLSGDYQTAGSFTINEKVDHIKMNTPAPQELTLVASGNGNSYSITIRFTVIQETVKGVEWDVTKMPANRISKADSPADRTLHAKVTNENATMQDVYYKLAEGSDPSVAIIDEATGEITVLKGGKASFKAFSAETKTIETLETITVDVYVPTVESPAKLLGEVNRILKGHIDSAAATFIAATVNTAPGDWWQGSSSSWKANGVLIYNNYGTGQTAADSGINYTDFQADLGTIGKAVFNTAKPIAVWAKDINEAFGAGYLSRDPLERIGFNDNNYNPANEIVIDLPENQGTATIKINNVYVLEDAINNMKPGETGGTYTITFSEDILTESGLLIQSGKQNPTVINAKDAVNRIKVN